MKLQKGTSYYTNRHSCFLLQYHLVVVVKYRRPVIDGEIKVYLLSISQELLEGKWKCNVISINADKDHIHILFEAPPQVCLSVLANNYKTVTSRYIRKNYKNEISPLLWGTQFWSDSYFVCTVSDRSVIAVKEYIDNQGG